MNGNEALDAIAAQFGIDPSTGTVTPLEDAQTDDSGLVDPLEGWTPVGEPEEPWWAAAGLGINDIRDMSLDETLPARPELVRRLLTRDDFRRAFERQGEGSAIASIKSLREAKAEEPSADQLVDGLLVRSAVTMVAGSSEAGKTTFCYHLALGVAAGRPTILGLPLHARTGRILWISAEGGWRQELKQREAITPPELEARFDALGFDPDTGIDGALQLTYRKGRELDNYIEWSLLGQGIGPDVYDLVIVDHLTGFATSMSGESQNDASSIAPLLAALGSFATQTGAAVLLIHHNNRTGGEYAGSFYAKAGTRALIALTRDGRSGAVTLKATSNYFPELKMSIDQLIPLAIGQAARIEGGKKDTDGAGEARPPRERKSRARKSGVGGRPSGITDRDLKARLMALTPEQRKNATAAAKVLSEAGAGSVNALRQRIGPMLKG